MSQNRIDKLNSIGFDWSVLSYKSWDENYGLLLEYKRVNGYCKVPRNHAVLGPWVMHQRSDRTTMSQNRIEKLDSIGFIWDVNEHDWNENYKQLMEYQRKNGNCKVPIIRPLGQWIHKQMKLRSLIGSAKISIEDKRRLDLLSNISFFQKCKCDVCQFTGCNEDKYL
ncbi:hypothetical protein ACHAWO_003815 [Cyclotella atomus]|uniref:Helicase-associated domain-containing protein n=1 Tax=Cyclotella atomus TaxID=382360 RepID=A0ABD3NI39_9STRA